MNNNLKCSLADVVKGRIVATSHQARGVENTERFGEVRIHFNTDLHQSFLTCQAPDDKSCRGDQQIQCAAFSAV